MRPGTNFLRAMTLLCVVALLVPIAREIVYLVVLGFCALLTVAAVEWTRLRTVSVVNDRVPKTAIALGELEPINFSLSTNSGDPLHLTVRQVWPGIVEAETEVRHATLQRGEIIQFESNVRGVQRGTVPLAAPAVAATFWKFVEKILPAGRATELSVIPNTHAVARLHEQLNAFVLRGLGTRMAPRLGKGREFDRLREYVQDDDYRDIAWRASARHNKLIVREYRLDRSQEIVLCVDRGHRMAARVGHLSRLDHAINAVLLLSYVCNRMEDRVGVVSFADTVERGASPGRGAAHSRQLTEYLTTLHATYRHTDYVAVAANLRRMLRHRSLIVFLTVLPEPQERHDLLRAVQMLTPQHLPLVIVLTDPQLKVTAQMLPSDKKELCRTLVARELWHGRATLMKELRHRGAIVVDTTPEQSPVAAVNAYIDIKRRQLL